MPIAKLPSPRVDSGSPPLGLAYRGLRFARPTPTNRPDFGEPPRGYAWSSPCTFGRSMRHPAEVSTSRRPAGWGPAADAPTFLSPESPSIAALAPRRPGRPKSDSVITSAPKAPPLQPAQAAPVAAPPFVQFPGGAAFDPLLVPLPPELAPPIYGWLRRLALQADLPGADRLLRDALAELTDSLSALVLYPGPDGLHTLAPGDELPADTQPIIAVATARRALIGSHTALVPIATTTETIAVIQLVRNPRQPAYEVVDHVTMAALARESASIMHHLVVQHLQHRSELEADKKSLYRPEALESHRTRGHEGVVAELTPTWVRRTYQILIAAIVAAVCFAVFITVPTYSSGTGMVMFEGTPVTAPAPGGTVDVVHVQSAQHVRKGDPLVTLRSDKEESDLEHATSQLAAALQQYLFDQSDEAIKKTVIDAQAAAKRAEDALEQRTVRAPRDGTVSDIRIRAGAGLQFGDPVLTIVEPGTEPELWAYLPGSDRPRLHPGMELQIELAGYQKTRERAAIHEVGRDVIGAAEARRALGAERADALKLAQDGGSYVLVKARLPRRTFKTKGRTYHFHQGMPAKTEVRVENKRFVVTLLPSLEKYLD
jgi:biotin carboxyl carrier protein